MDDSKVSRVLDPFSSFVSKSDLNCLFLQAEKDRLTAQNDYSTDCKGEEEIRFIMRHLDHQDDLNLQIVKRLEEQHVDMMAHLSRLDPGMAQQLGRM